MNALDELATILKPAGGGLYLVSTGLAEQQRLQRTLYRAESDAEVQLRFRDSLERLATAKGAMLGIPSDVGAGFLRGANTGPQAMRLELLDASADWPEHAKDLGLVDVGDVLCVPQLQHDEMLNEAQLAASLKATWDAPARVLAERLLRILEARAAAVRSATLTWTLRGDADETRVVETLTAAGGARRPHGLLVDSAMVADASLALTAAGLGPITALRPDFVFEVNCAAFNNLTARLF